MPLLDLSVVLVEIGFVRWIEISCRGQTSFWRQSQLFNFATTFQALPAAIAESFFCETLPAWAESQI